MYNINIKVLSKMEEIMKIYKILLFLSVSIIIMGLLFFLAGYYFINNNYHITAGVLFFVGIVLNINLIISQPREAKDKYWTPPKFY